MPVVFVGLVLCLTVVGAPLGILLILLGIWPFYRACNEADMISSKRTSSTLMNEMEETEVPWILPDNDNVIYLDERGKGSN